MFKNRFVTSTNLNKISTQSVVSCVMYCILSLIFFILCIVRGTQTVVINRIPEDIWGQHWAGNFTELCGIPCVHADNHPNPDAEFFIAMSNNDVQNAINRQSNISISILGSKEGSHYYSLLNQEYLNTHFQGSAVLNWDSEIPWLFMPNMDELKQVQLPKDPIPKATYVARNCMTVNNRNTYVEEIDSVIGVVAPGSCFHNTEWPKCDERDCSKVEVIRNYKIHLAFENGNSLKYVTEKIYQAFQAGVLPVYFGTQYVSEAVPKGSYIDVADFDSPNSLALYLAKVLANDTLYQSYFEWKLKPFDKEFEDRFRVLWSVPFNCRLCRYVDAYKNNLGWDQYRQKAKNIKVEILASVAPTADALTFLIVDFNRRHGYILIVSFVVFFVVIRFRQRIYNFFVKLDKYCF